MSRVGRVRISGISHEIALHPVAYHSAVGGEEENSREMLIRGRATFTLRIDQHFEPDVTPQQQRYQYSR